MSDQLQLIETAPIVPILRGIIEIARGVFRNLDTGITWSLHSYPWCCALHESGGRTFMCRRRIGHGGRHKTRTHEKGFWERVRWTDAECHHMTSPVAGKPGNTTGYGPEDRRERPLSVKQSIRRKALRRRMNLKNPLFVEAEISAAFELNPDYYGNVRP